MSHEASMEPKQLQDNWSMRRAATLATPDKAAQERLLVKLAANLICLWMATPSEGETASACRHKPTRTVNWTQHGKQASLMLQIQNILLLVSHILALPPTAVKDNIDCLKCYVRESLCMYIFSDIRHLCQTANALLNFSCFA